MQLKNIKITNFVGLPAADIEFDKPVTLFVGKNNQGKSSVKDALEFGFTGKCRAMKKFKDVRNLVRGDNSMAIELGTTDPETGEIKTRRRSVSSVSTNAIDIPIFRYCLNPDDFIRLSANERGKILSEVLGGGLDEVAKSAIAEHIGNIIEALLTEIKHSGVDVLDVDALKKQVVEIRRQYKRDKQALPDSPPVMSHFSLPDNYDVDTDEKAVKVLGERIAKGGELIADAKRQLEIKAELIDIEKKLEEEKGRIKEVPTLPDDVSADDLRMASVYCTIIDELLGSSRAANIKCPLSDSSSHKRESYEKRRADIDEWLEKYQQKLADIESIGAENKIAGYEIRQLEARRVELNKKSTNVEYKKGSENLLRTLTDERDDLQANIANYRRFKEAEAEYEQAGKDVKKLEELIAECDRIDGALKDGGPVKSAIASGGRNLPINENLLRLWDMAELTWSDNGEIALRDIPIEYASASEKYRAGCVMGLALAEVSGVGIAALDGFEVLDPDNSNAFFEALEGCKINNVLVFYSSDKDYSQVKIPDWLRVFQVSGGKVIAL